MRGTAISTPRHTTPTTQKPKTKTNRKQKQTRPDSPLVLPTALPFRLLTDVLCPVPRVSFAAIAVVYFFRGGALGRRGSGGGGGGGGGGVGVFHSVSRNPGVGGDGWTDGRNERNEGIRNEGNAGKWHGREFRKVRKARGRKEGKG